MAPPPHPSACDSEVRSTAGSRRARSAGSAHFEASFAASTSAAEDPKASVTSPVASMSSINSSRMAMLSPTTRGLMDPFHRLSQKKRLSADFSDLTYSAESCGSSPKSEKGGWRIHSAVAGPFLTGPLAQDFAHRLEDLMSPRLKNREEVDFDNAGLLFPVPAYVPPAITPNVFQAAAQPPPQQEMEAYYPPPTHQEHSAPPNAYELNSFDLQAPYAPQQNGAAWHGGYPEYSEATPNEYHAQEYYPQQATVPEANHFPAQEEYPPLVHEAVNHPTDEPTMSVHAPPQPIAAPPASDAPQAKPTSPPVPTRPRAPSFAEVVSGVSTTESKPAPRSPRKSSIRDAFTEVSDTIGASMDRILSKTKEGRTHAEIELSCLIRKIQTQLKIMGKFSGDMRIAQVKAMKKLKQAEAEKRSLKEENEKLTKLVEGFETEKENLRAEFQQKSRAKEDELQKSMSDLRAEIEQLKATNEVLQEKLEGSVKQEAETRADTPVGTEVPQLKAKIIELEKTVALLSSKTTVHQAAHRRPTPAVQSSRKSTISRKSFVLYSAGVVAASAGIYAGLSDGLNMPDVTLSHDFGHFSTGISPSSAVGGLARALASLSSSHISTGVNSVVVDSFADNVSADVVAPAVVEVPVLEVPVVEPEVEPLAADEIMESPLELQESDLIDSPRVVQVEAPVEVQPDSAKVPETWQQVLSSLPTQAMAAEVVREEFVGVFEPAPFCHKNESTALAVCERKLAKPSAPVHVPVTPVESPALEAVNDLVPSVVNEPFAEKVVRAPAKEVSPTCAMRPFYKDFDSVQRLVKAAPPSVDAEPESSNSSTSVEVDASDDIVTFGKVPVPAQGFCSFTSASAILRGEVL
ncbi:hypothetical protein ATCC90586_009944 [Pythium insidiosum]|nr:hypothetical protein ATCC90586_009944 [Pythium insidiosum]